MGKIGDKKFQNGLTCLAFNPWPTWEVTTYCYLTGYTFYIITGRDVFNKNSGGNILNIFEIFLLVA